MIVSISSILVLIRRLNPNYILLGLVALAICYNTYIHSESPVYKYYKDYSIKLDDRISDFEQRVQNDLALQFSNLLYRALSPVTSPASVGINFDPSSVKTDITITQSSFLSPFLEVERDYSYTDVRFNGDVYHGAYIDGHFYKLGDTFLGRSILEFHPDCIILDRGVIIHKKEKEQMVYEQS